MKHSEFTAAFRIADNDDTDLSGEDITVLDGYGKLGFKPVAVTLNQMAKLIRHQCRYMGRRPGGPKWDMEELNIMRDLLRKRVTILDAVPA